MPPAPPWFIARSFPLARFGVVGRSGTVVELVRSPSTCPDLGTFFRKNACSAYFLLENASQIGLSIPEGIAPPPDQRQRSQKRASGSKRAIKPGVQGACPRPSFSPFLGRNGDPRRAGGAPGALRPKAGKRPAHPKGTQHRAASGRGAGLGPSQVQTCNVVSRPAPGGSPAFSGESRRKERRGPCPLDPLFYGPLVGTRSFWGWVSHCSSRGAITVPMCVP